MTTSSPSFSESVFGCVYGPSGWGKTVDALFAFPQAIFLAMPGALKGWKNIVGLPFEPAQPAGAIRTIPEATEFIRANGKNRTWTGFVVDDFSLMADRTVAQIEAKYTAREARVFWGEIRKVMIDFRDVGREFQKHIIVNCHIRPPHTHEKKGWIMGGPALPGTMPEDFPKAVDLCVRVVKEDTYPDWPFVFAADPRDAEYVQKTRLGEAASLLPMNTGELLRLDYGVEGPLGLARLFPWQEKVVEKLAVYLSKYTLGSDQWKDTCRQALPLVREKAKTTANGSDFLVERHVRWTMRDAVARALLKQTAQKDLTSAYTS